MQESKQPIIKAATSTIEIGLTWSALLKSGLDSIETSVWSCDDPELLISRQQITSPIVSCVLSGGVNGKQYKVFNTVTTSSSDLADSRYFVILIKDTQA